MDPGRGRRATFPAARLALITGLLAVLAVLRLVRGGDGAGPPVQAAPSATDGRAGESVAALLGPAETLPDAAGPAGALAAPAADPWGGAAPPWTGELGPASVPAGERAAREAAIEAVIARWMRAFEKEARGKADAGDVVVAVHAIELGAERAGLLASRRADASLLPASNMKLVTSIAALRRLTPEGRFTTRVVAGGPVQGGVLRGDLVVRAGGDPLCDPAGDEGSGAVEARLDELARAIRAHGVDRVTGDLVLDEGAFQTPCIAPGWPHASQHWAAYCALPGGLTVNGGVLRATLLDHGASGRPRVIVHPAPHGLRENYDVRTGARNDVRVGATATTCTVKGELPAANVAAFAAAFAHPDPVELFGSVFAASLQRAGVRVDGAVVRRRGAAAEGAVLAELSTPILDVLVPINTHSTNGVAEQLFLALGAQAEGDGSRAGGMRAVQAALAEIGIPTEGYVQADGSGLSRDNRATARQLVALLEAAWRMPAAVREAVFGSLAVAGRTGTLADRLDGTPAEGRVRAKTGWIEGASSLSGLARAGPGGDGGDDGDDGERDVLFSILVSYPRELGGMNTRVFKPMQDEIVLTLCGDAE
jgi:D-alanyl-D-alanine carboxypeptidase/D-alanyl-D-alanine-endopeptidase (penicillin-binding protein 4)